MAALRKLFSWLLPLRVKNVEGQLTSQLEVSYENGKKVLNAGEVNYSFGALHDVFRRALQKAKISEQPPQNVLILGLGAGSIVSILVDEQHLDPRMVGVEADPEVIRLAKEEFNIERYSRLEICNETAEKFISEDQRQYDLIAVDVFVEAVVPETCKSETFLRGLYAHLQKGGRVVFNEMKENAEEDAFAKRFRKVFDQTEIHQLMTGDAANRILIGWKR